MAQVQLPNGQMVEVSPYSLYPGMEQYLGYVPAGGGYLAPITGSGSESGLAEYGPTDYLGSSGFGIPFAPSQEQMQAGAIPTFFNMLNTLGFRAVERIAQAGWFDGLTNNPEELSYIQQMIQKIGHPMGQQTFLEANMPALMIGGAALGAYAGLGAETSAVGAEGSTVAPYGGFDAAAVGGADYAGTVGTTETLLNAAGPAVGTEYGLEEYGLEEGVDDYSLDGSNGLDDFFNNFDINSIIPSANTAAALAPILAAIAYAKNFQVDTSRLESDYGAFDPSLMAREYDQNTALGKSALVSDIQRRGLGGSSFAKMDRVNFDTARDLGRRDLINRGVLSRSGIANNILEAQLKERMLKNQLYGSSLLALGNVFGGRNGTATPTSGGSSGVDDWVNAGLSIYDYIG